MAFRITYSVLDADMTELNTAFDGAMKQVKAGLGKEHPSWIAGKAHSSGVFLDDTNPADTRELLGRFHTISAADVDQVIEVSKRAQKKWGQTPWQDRVTLMRKAADIISGRRLQMAAVLTLEVGKNRLESLGDVEESADLLRYYAAQMEEANGFLKPLAKLQANEDTRSVLRPYGVFAVLAPFNFPMALGAGMAAAALLGGNTVVFKPSEETPWSGELIYEAFRDAGLPEGVFQLVYGAGKAVGAALAAHPDLDGIVFTGSKAVGMHLMHTVATRYPKPVFAEMGGKNAAIICSSADLDKAVSGCTRSAFGLSGQKCSALSRIYVHARIHDEFLNRLLLRTQTLKIGNPAEHDVFVGPVINAAARQRFLDAAAEAKRDGSIHTGGVALDQFPHGFYVAPTVVTVPTGHRIAKEELFLPFVVIEPFEALDDAINKANAVDYGLTGGIFSADKAEIEQFMATTEAGVLYSNRETGATTGAWPGVQSFCGWKGSGASGKGGCGPYYVSQFMREQSQTRMG